MKEDKITAMWEEDGDLMRIKDFFAYVYQDNDLKERVKRKTLDRIEMEQTKDHVPEKDQIGQDAQISVKNETNNNKKIFLLSGLKKQLKNSKKALKMLSAAAVVVFAVYLGSTGTLTDNGLLRLGSADKAATEESGARNMAQGIAPTAPAPAPDMITSMSKGKEMMDMDNGSSFNSVSERNGSSPEQNLAGDADIKQKIIYTLEATLKVDNVSAAIQALEEKVTSAGGYISESRQNNEENNTNAYLTLRVPVAHFDEIKGNLSEIGTVSNQNLYTEDVSRQYFDVETRLRSWEAQEKRYLEILEQAKTVEEILRIEDSLANVRREMESLKGQLKYWDNRVEYSEVRLYIYQKQSNIAVNNPWQPVSLESTFNAAKNAVIKTISFLWNSINYLVVFLGYALPVGLILGIIWFSYRQYRRYRSK